MFPKKMFPKKMLLGKPCDPECLLQRPETSKLPKVVSIGCKRCFGHLEKWSPKSLLHQWNLLVLGNGNRGETHRAILGGKTYYRARPLNWFWRPQTVGLVWFVPVPSKENDRGEWIRFLTRTPNPRIPE